MHYFAHWITPEGEPKRFDTRFFLARAPEGQVYAHDDGELIGSEWVRPADALRRHRAGDFAMIGPTVVSLQDIGRFATCDELLSSRSRATAGADGRPREPPTTPRSRSARPIVPGVASALSPLVRRIVANNPGLMTGPGTNTYLVGIDEIVVIDPGPDDAGAPRRHRRLRRRSHPLDRLHPHPPRPLARASPACASAPAPRCWRSTRATASRSTAPSPTAT